MRTNRVRGAGNVRCGTQSEDGAPRNDDSPANALFSFFYISTHASSLYPIHVHTTNLPQVLHRAVKLRGHARRRLAQPSMHMEEPPHPPALDGWDGNGGSGAAAEEEEEAMPEGPVPPTGSGEGGSGGWAAGAKASASSSSSSSWGRRGGGPHSGHLLVKAQHLEIDRHEIRILAKLGEGYFGACGGTVGMGDGWNRGAGHATAFPSHPSLAIAHACTQASSSAACGRGSPWR